MRLHFACVAALSLATLVAGGQSLAAGNQSGRLAALTARQGLCDMIAYAQADGHISQSERVAILQEAKSILTPQEFQSFKQALDRVAPPPPPKAKPKVKHIAKAVPKVKVVAKKSVAKVAKSTAEKKTLPAEKSPELIMPASVNLPDGVAPPVFFR